MAISSVSSTNITSWQFDPNNIKNCVSNYEFYSLVDANQSEFDKVKLLYKLHPMPGHKIKSVKLIVNTELEKSFESTLKIFQRRTQNTHYKPTWPYDAGSVEARAKIVALFKEIAQPYIDINYPNICIFPTWHGTEDAIVKSICEGGYGTFGRDADFGVGVYSTLEAEYAYRVYARKALLLNWTAAFLPFPVLSSDQLQQTATKDPYDAHFIPVVPLNPKNLNEGKYLACQPDQKHVFTEITVSRSAACLPRYLVELELKSPEKLFKLGEKYFNEDDYYRAFELFSLSAETGNYPAAHNNIGLCYENGLGVEKDLKKAFESYKLAHKAFSYRGSYNLALCYDAGKGIEQDFIKAFEYFGSAATEGLKEAQQKVGHYLEMGIGTIQNLKLALKYYLLAADQGCAESQFKAGLFYEEGKGTEVNSELALKYLAKAYDQKHLGAREQYPLLYAKYQAKNHTKPIKIGSQEYATPPVRHKEEKFIHPTPPNTPPPHHQSISPLPSFQTRPAIDAIPDTRNEGRRRRELRANLGLAGLRLDLRLNQNNFQ